MKIGSLSDTHNLLRPEVLEHLRDSDCILHGGDISRQDILDRLEEIAPVRAVRGNNDKEWAEHLPAFLDFELAGLHFFMTHKKKDLPKDLSPYDIAVTGHTHQYQSVWVSHADGRRTLMLNPGSCGPRRFYQAITMTLLTVDGDGWRAERIEIPHEQKGTKLSRTDMKSVIDTVTAGTRKGKSVEEIALKHRLDRDLVEQIVRLYVTHPGVDADGIMTKMGL